MYSKTNNHDHATRAYVDPRKETTPPLYFKNLQMIRLKKLALIIFHLKILINKKLHKIKDKTP